MPCRSFRCVNRVTEVGTGIGRTSELGGRRTNTPSYTTDVYDTHVLMKVRIASPRREGTLVPRPESKARVGVRRTRFCPSRHRLAAGGTHWSHSTRPLRRGVHGLAPPKVGGACAPRVTWRCQRADPTSTAPRSGKGVAEPYSLPK